MPARPRVSVPALLAAIDRHGGKLGDVARELGHHRRWIERRVSRNKRLRVAAREARNRVGDVVERTLHRALALEAQAVTEAVTRSAQGLPFELPSTLVSRWYARFALRDRGYGVRHELVGARGAQRTLEAGALDLSVLSDDELELLALLLTKAARAAKEV
jgi:hypothetical protein